MKHSASGNFAATPTDKRSEVGSYERSFIVDGVEYELYAQLDGDECVYELVDQAGKTVAEGLAEIPDAAAAAALIREQAEPL
jgi:hypothetical protein